MDKSHKKEEKPSNKKESSKAAQQKLEAIRRIQEEKKRKEVIEEFLATHYPVLTDYGTCTVYRLKPGSKAIPLPWIGTEYKKLE